jgi:hypothetical protein
MECKKLVRIPFVLVVEDSIATVDVLGGVVGNEVSLWRWTHELSHS